MQWRWSTRTEVQRTHDRVVDANFEFVGLTVLSVTFTGFLLPVSKIQVRNTAEIQYSSLSFSSLSRKHFGFCG